MSLGSPSRPLALTALVSAVLVAVSALGGIFVPAIYARETPSWAAQGIGQDWVNLLVAVPWLVAAGIRVGRGSRVAELLLGGALVYNVYSYVLYAFAVHFNALFLVYCAVLGLAFWGMVAIGVRFLRDPARLTPAPGVPVKLMGGLLLAIGGIFYVLWLSEDVPALLRGTPPASLAEVDLPTNPIHVIDLAVVLPAMIWGGVSLLRRRATGVFVGTVMLSFGILMAVAIGGMILLMAARGLPVDVAPSVVMGLVAVASAVALVRFLKHQVRLTPGT